MKNRTTTPRELTASILNFCSSISRDSTPIYLPVPSSGSEDEYQNCFENAEKKVQEHGGKQILGWIIWIFPNIMMEAEAHAVWQTPDGNLVDITPQRDGEREVLFLEDSSLHYEGIPIRNIRAALTKSPLALEFIAICNQINELQQKPIGTCVSIPTNLLIRKEELLTIFYKKVGRNEFCPCQSGLKYKKCCGRYL